MRGEGRGGGGCGGGGGGGGAAKMTNAPEDTITVPCRRTHARVVCFDVADVLLTDVAAVVYGTSAADVDVYVTVTARSLWLWAPYLKRWQK
ncbi:Hypothetical predicted protein [Octopus vulgaris]|uniref:Uncharacterized protein n=1 Tax=Octopus vulgaris TaxID=6645 RepID=A0AA36APN6_OCTVU|nr:Hypothetical predicted protein [Octopus vulgaris]